jgi:nucleoside 2-deoxyribosyltransferase
MLKKIYVAGKVSKTSIFKTHHWRDDFCAELSELSDTELENLDPLKAQEEYDNKSYEDTSIIFAKDCRLINQADFVVVYLSDDISVGGSQEILIAKYLNKPVIGFAPYGGKFNGASREMLGKQIENYKDSFVFTTCDVVCGTIEEVGEAIKTIDKIQPKTLQIIDEALKE